MATLTRITLGELLDRLEERVGFHNSFWNDDEGRDAINEAISVWQGITGEWPYYIKVTANGSAFYDIPKQLPALYRVGYVANLTTEATAPTPVTNTSVWELDHGIPSWTVTAGTPQLWARFGVSRLAVYPQPTAGYFVLFGYKEPPTLDVAGNYVDLGDEEITRLLDYAQYFMAFKEGVGEGTDNVDRILQAFLTAGGLRNRRLLATNIYRKYMGEARDVRQRPFEVPRGQG